MTTNIVRSSSLTGCSLAKYPFFKWQMAMNIFLLTHILSFFYHGQDFCRTIWANRRVSLLMRNTNCFTLRANTWVHSGFFCYRIRVAHSFSFLCGGFCLFFLRSVFCAQCFLCMSLNCPFLIVPSVFSSIYLYVMFSFMSYFPSCYAFLYVMVPSWSWSFGSWIHNYLCNQYLSPLKLDPRSWQGVLDKTLCDKVVSGLLQVCGFLQALQFPPPIKLTATI